MVKQLNLHFDDDKFKEIKENKEKSGKSWEDYIYSLAVHTPTEVR
jgi:hypothetical protein